MLDSPNDDLPHIWWTAIVAFSSFLRSRSNISVRAMSLEVSVSSRVLKLRNSCPEDMHYVQIQHYDWLHLRLRFIPFFTGNMDLL
jgi:hypothetical protein